MNSRSSVLSRIIKNDCCTGCGICSAVADGGIDIKMSTAGFLRPVQRSELAFETDRLIAEICPGINLDRKPIGNTDHVLWGPLIGIRTGASTDAELRHHASSGGAISGLLIYLLDFQVIDYVVQIGASTTSPMETAIIHSVSRSDIYRAAGSRYAPSSPLANLNEMLSAPGKFALVGKPCDIAAVRALGRRDHRIAEKIPILLSFFCAGVPSATGAQRILDKLGVSEDELASFQFRGDGWPGRATAKLRNGQETSMSYAQSWGDTLSKHVQFRCKICPDGSGGFADIACGDAWHCDDYGYPLFEEEDGRSLIVTRTDIGEDVVQNAIIEGYLTVDTLDQAEIEKMQPSQAIRKQMVLSRLAAMVLLAKRPPRFRGMMLLRAALSGGLFLNAKNFFGMMRRQLLSHLQY